MPLVSVEGVDGAGKTTLIEGLARARPEAVVLREPGGVALSERIRELVKGDPMDPVTEALLFAAARAELVAARLRPLLAAGTLVVLDRFVDSSLAYQGAARGLGVERVRAINAFATGGLAPDRTFLLRLDPALAAARRGAPDRIEAAGADFFAAIARAYDALAAAEPARWRVLDATAPPEDVLAAALDQLPA